ncbi:hypothetical protein ABZY42_24960 [Streptomyces sp. NPDC006622]
MATSSPSRTREALRNRTARRTAFRKHQSGSLLTMHNEHDK